MFRFLRKHKTVFMVSLAAVFVGMIFFGIGGSVRISPQDAIAKVNGKKISQLQFDRLFNQILRQKPDMTAEERKKLVGEAFNELVRQEVFAQEAAQYGIQVTDQEVQMYLASIPAFQHEGKFHFQKYAQTVTQIFGMTPKQFEKERRKDIAARKLNQLISASVHITNEEFKKIRQRRLALETDPAAKKELRENPEKLRNEVRNREMNLVFGDWLNQLNSKLKVTIVSENFRKRLQGQI